MAATIPLHRSTAEPAGQRGMNELQIGPIVLWRESKWRCEGFWHRSAWTLHLFSGEVLVGEVVSSEAGAMLQAAERWHTMIEHDASAATPARHAGNSRRQGAADRRAVPRGGRRATDRIQ